MGVRHLKKLQLVPGGFGHRTETEEKRMAQERGKTGRHGPLHTEIKFNYGVGGSGDEVRKQDCECSCGAHLKVKSGKYAKNSTHLVRQEMQKIFQMN